MFVIRIVMGLIVTRGIVILVAVIIIITVRNSSYDIFWGGGAHFLMKNTVFCCFPSFSYIYLVHG